MSKVGWKIKKRVRFSEPLEIGSTSTEEFDVELIQSYESMLNSAVDYPVPKFPIPNVIYQRKMLEVEDNFDVVRYILDFMDNFFPWNRQLALLILVWGFCGIIWKGSFENIEGKQSLCGFIFILGSIVGISHVLLDAGGFWVRDYLERKQYERWVNARRIQTSRISNKM